MVRTIKLMLLCLIILNVRLAEAQYNEPAITPPSPEVKALKKFVDQPVDNFHGTPVVEIPFWNIMQDGVNVPIKLRYHAGGFQVSEIASGEGLGWALDAGGVVSREVRGGPDDNGTGFTSCEKIAICPINWEDGADKMSRVARGEMDWEPDVFTYSMPDATGKFVFDQNSNIHQLPVTANKIVFNGTSITITNESGIVFEFSQVETSYRNQPFDPSGNTQYRSSWHLTRIHFPWADTSHDIVYEYESYQTSVTYPLSETYCPEYGAYSTYNQMVLSHQSFRVTKIQYDQGSVNFTYGPYRRDLEGAQVLQSITIKDLNEATIKNFDFAYQYFATSSFNSLAQWPATAITPSNDNLRLCLRDITEQDRNGNSLPPYEFTYNTTAWLPNRVDSKAVDIWGYYNGKTDNTTLIPNYPINYLDNGTYPILSEGGDRYPDESFGTAGVLKRITYPTGGYTEYDYEINKIDPSSAPQVEYPVTYISNTTVVKPCQIVTGQDFTINEANDPHLGSVVTLRLIGSVLGTNQQTCGTNSQSILEQYPDRYISFRIYNINDLQNPVHVSSGGLTIDGTSKNGVDYVYLPNGTYRVRVFKGGLLEATNQDATINSDFVFTIKGIVHESTNYKLAGGIRIKDIKTYASSSSEPLFKGFDYSDGVNQSGRINVAPIFRYWKTVAGQGPEYAVTVHTSDAAFKSYYDGVGYTIVTEYNGTDGSVVGTQGKTVYTYDYPDDYAYFDLLISAGSPPVWDPDNYFFCYSPGQESNCVPMPESYGFSYPFTPPVSHSWHRGLLTDRLIYSYDGVFHKVEEIENTYKDDYYGDLNGYNPDTDVLGANAVKFGNSSGNSDILITYHYIQSRLVNLAETRHIYYDASENIGLVKTQDFYYDNLAHLQPSRTIDFQSDGKQKIMVTLYPDDFTNTTGFVGEMKDRNFKNAPIETVSFEADPSRNNEKILSGQIISYLTGNNMGKISEIRSLQIDNPIPLAAFHFSNQTFAGVIPNGLGERDFALTGLDSHYGTTPEISLEYDQVFSNVIKKTERKGNQITAYLWGYAGALPVSEVVNAGPNEIYYNGFEEDGNSTQDDAYAGRYSKTGGFTINLTGLTSGKSYILSYWNKSGGWIYHSQTMQLGPTTSTYTINLIGQIDELRFFPSDAQMTTYTFSPAIGVTSTMDKNSVVTYYEYDGFGRLTAVKDANGNLVKSYGYHYNDSQ